MYATCTHVKWRKTSPLLLTYVITDGWTWPIMRLCTNAKLNIFITSTANFSSALLHTWLAVSCSNTGNLYVERAWDNVIYALCSRTVACRKRHVSLVTPLFGNGFSAITLFFAEFQNKKHLWNQWIFLLLSICKF